MADFDDLLGLEDRFYDEGYQLGLEDGNKAGRIEGRVFGLEKGFEKYMEMGKLHGRSLIWNARHSAIRNSTTKTSDTVKSQASCNIEERDTSNAELDVQSLPNNPRLEKHLRVLYALTEPESLSTENTEDAVSDFNDRLKRAQGKIKIVERLVGEEAVLPVDEGQQSSGGANGQNIEDVDILKARH